MRCEYTWTLMADCLCWKLVELRIDFTSLSLSYLQHLNENGGQKKVRLRSFYPLRILRDLICGVVHSRHALLSIMGLGYEQAHQMATGTLAPVLGGESPGSTHSPHLSPEEPLRTVLVR